MQQSAAIQSTSARPNFSLSPPEAAPASPIRIIRARTSPGTPAASTEALKQVNKELAESNTAAEARLAELRRCAPDLADLVDDERLTLAEAARRRWRHLCSKRFE